MSIIEQRVDADGLFLKAANQRTFFISAADLKALYTAQSSSKDGVRNTLKTQIETALGSNMFDAATYAFNFDPSTGAPLTAVLYPTSAIKSAKASTTIEASK